LQKDTGNYTGNDSTLFGPTPPHGADLLTDKQTIPNAIKTYTFTTSLADLIGLALVRFVVYSLVYTLCKVRRKWPLITVAVLTTLFTGAKVMLTNLTEQNDPTYFLLYLQAVLFPWAEAWFHTARTLSVEKRFDSLQHQQLLRKYSDASAVEAGQLARGGGGGAGGVSRSRAGSRSERDLVGLNSGLTNQPGTTDAHSKTGSVYGSTTDVRFGSPSDFESDAYDTPAEESISSREASPMLGMMGSPNGVAKLSDATVWKSATSINVCHWSCVCACAWWARGGGVAGQIASALLAAGIETLATPRKPDRGFWRFHTSLLW
jgi:hypothetical protein